MTPYEQASISIAVIALVFSIPSIVLAIRAALKDKISISITSEYIRYTHQNDKYTVNAYYHFVNRSSVPFTILKIDALYGNKTYEMFIDTDTRKGIFENVPIAANEAKQFRLSFNCNPLVQNKIKLKVYTNSKIITKNITLESMKQAPKQIR